MTAGNNQFLATRRDPDQAVGTKTVTQNNDSRIGRRLIDSLLDDLGKLFRRPMQSLFKIDDLNRLRAGARSLELRFHYPAGNNHRSF